jgi:hypothetical protein
MRVVGVQQNTRENESENGACPSDLEMGRLVIAL